MSPKSIWLFITFYPHFLKKVFLSHLKLYIWSNRAERQRRKARRWENPQHVTAQTESWPEDPILGLVWHTDENLVRHSCCFLRDEIKEKQGSNLLLTLCVALSPTLRLCAQIKISRRQNRDETPLCAILIEIQKYKNTKTQIQMPDIELYRNTEQEILETENSWYDF